MALILTKGMGSVNRMLIKGFGAVGEPPTFVRQGFLDRFPADHMMGRKTIKNKGFIHVPGKGN